MRGDDRDDPFDDIFSEIERLMEEMMGSDTREIDPSAADSGFGTDAHVDIHDTGEQVRVIADLPGVERDDLELKCDGELFTIAASTERRELEERITLPARVDEHSAKATFNNGVLEVTFDRIDDSANISLD